MHFYDGPYLTYGVIAHESYHVSENIRSMLHINTSRADGEELIADTIELTLKGAVDGIRKLGYRIRR